MTNQTRITTIAFPTQDYTSHQHGDATIDCYVTEPDGGVTERTGFLLLIHASTRKFSVSSHIAMRQFKLGLVSLP